MPPSAATLARRDAAAASALELSATEEGLSLARVAHEGNAALALFFQALLDDETGNRTRDGSQRGGETTNSQRQHDDDDLDGSPRPPPPRRRHNPFVPTSSLFASHWPRVLRRALASIRAHPRRVHGATGLRELPGIGASLSALVESHLWSRQPPSPPTADESARDAEARAAARAAKASERRAAREGSGGALGAEALASLPSSAPASSSSSGYSPAVGTACYAFLVALHHLQVHERKPWVTRADLIVAAEASGLAHRPIMGTGVGGATSTTATATAAAAPRPTSYPFGGWSSFRALSSREPPLVACWSSPLRAALTREGALLAARLRRDALDKGTLPAAWRRPEDSVGWGGREDDPTGQLLPGLRRLSVEGGGVGRGGGARAGATAAAAAFPPPGLSPPVSRSAGARDEQGDDFEVVLEGGEEGTRSGGGIDDSGCDGVVSPSRLGGEPRRQQQHQKQRSRRRRRSSVGGAAPKRRNSGGGDSPAVIVLSDDGGGSPSPFLRRQQQRRPSPPPATAGRDDGPLLLERPLRERLGLAPLVRPRLTQEEDEGERQRDGGGGGRGRDADDERRRRDERQRQQRPASAARPPPPPRGTTVAAGAAAGAASQRQQAPSCSSFWVLPTLSPPPPSSGGGGENDAPLPAPAPPPAKSGRRNLIRCPPLPPGAKSFSECYDVVLVLDTREQYEGSRGGPSSSTSARTDAALAALAAAGTRVERRQIPAGDALWLARPKAAAFPSPSDEDGEESRREYVLDLVVERKRADDLVNSIKSGRLARQAAALKKSGLGTVALLVEGDARVLCAGSAFGGGNESLSASAPARAAKMVASASHSAEVHDGFHVLRAPGGAPDSFRLYASLTRELERSLASTSSTSSSRGSPPSLDPSPSSADDFPPTYREFCATLSSSRERTARETWALMLTALPGVGASAASALSSAWPTPALFWRAARERAARASDGIEPPSSAVAAERAREGVVSMLASVPRERGGGGGGSGTVGRAAAAAAVDALTDGGAALVA